CHRSPPCLVLPADGRFNGRDLRLVTTRRQVDDRSVPFSPVLKSLCFVFVLTAPVMTATFVRGAASTMIWPTRYTRAPKTARSSLEHEIASSGVPRARASVRRVLENARISITQGCSTFAAPWSVHVDTAEQHPISERVDRFQPRGPARMVVSAS